ncbi:MAG: hypothetical protein EAZ07_00625 [Cytophagales bacterium]|nr:MAG: hypothetical protein EAZ07_00625 [Cytophagales bacterium]
MWNDYYSKLDKIKTEPIIIYLLISLGILIRIAFIFVSPAKDGDYEFYLYPWILFFQSHGYWNALKYEFYDYTPLYLYAVGLIAKSGLNPLVMFKILSYLFEYITAFFIGKIAQIKHPNPSTLLLSLGLFPLLPTVLINGGYWAQCDAIYVCFIIASIYYLMVNRLLYSIILLGIAFSLKLQTMIIAPFYLIMMLKGKVKWYFFLIVPFIYLLSISPAWIAGRPLDNLLSIYIRQSSQYTFLTLQFPNIYFWVNNDFYQIGKYLGLIFSSILVITTSFVLSNKKYDFSLDIWLVLALVSACVMPFILPGMHERYMYLGDTLAVIYVLYFRKNIALMASIVFISFYSYLLCTRLTHYLPLFPIFGLYVIVLYYLITNFIRQLSK